MEDTQQSLFSSVCGFLSVILRHMKIEKHIHCKLAPLSALQCLSIPSVTLSSSAKWLVRVWIQFMTIHHLWQVHTVIYFKQQGMKLMMHGRRGYTVHTWACILIINFLHFNHCRNKLIFSGVTSCCNLWTWWIICVVIFRIDTAHCVACWRKQGRAKLKCDGGDTSNKV